MSETVLANSPEARSETGEIKNLVESTEPKTETTTEPPKTEEPKAEPSKDGETLLTKKDGETEASKGAPEKYEPFTLPEGLTLDEPTTVKASELFKSLNLDQTQAQSLVDFHTAQLKAAAEGPLSTWKSQQDTWVKEVKADPDIGHHLPEVKATVAKAIDQTIGATDPKLAAAFREAMDYTGAGNNPAFIKTFYKLAQMVTEGSFVKGNKPSSFGQRAPDAGPKTAASAMFPHLPSAAG